MQRPASLHGFTLIELLVVVAIIVALLAILLPSMNQALLIAERTQCLARLRGLSHGLTTYASDHLGIFPAHRNGSQWGDAYDLRRGHPYGGPADRLPLNFGLLVSTQILPAGQLGDIVHCPSFDNTASTVAPGHCSDVQSNWGFGGSGWIDNPNHRILASYNYRGTSWAYQHGNTLPRVSDTTSSFVVAADTADLRFRGPESQFNQHGGYNRVFADGAGGFMADVDYVIDNMIQTAVSRATVDGRGNNGGGQGSLDEAIYEYMATTND